jgi:hypothetical protein
MANGNLLGFDGFGSNRTVETAGLSGEHDKLFERHPSSGADTP